tara:strand:- start:130 stop:423 length:294 start_codon:yes stop_codon:yes gene_type:complete
MKIFYICLITFFLIGCQTIENRSQQAIKKENEKLSKFLKKPEIELKIALGKPDKIMKGDNGKTFLVYTKKKFSITCERKFEIDQDKMVIGFTSNGCF